MNKPAQSRTLHLKTPGAVASDEAPQADPAALKAQIDAEAADFEKSLVADGDTVLSEPPAAPGIAPDLQAIVDAAVAKGVAAAMAAQRRAAAAPKAGTVLPDQADVDPRTIDSMTLTKQGYVIPASLGRIPAHLAAQMMRQE